MILRKEAVGVWTGSVWDRSDTNCGVRNFLKADRLSASQLGLLGLFTYI